MAKIIEVLQTEYVAGALIVSDQMMEEHFLNKLTIPIVTIDRKVSENVSSVTINNYENAREAVRYLIGKGCSTIAHLRGPAGIYTSEERLQGYRDEMAASGLPLYCGW